MSVFIGAIKGQSAISKKVAEVNALINEGNRIGIEVVDSSSTWQTPMRYKPIKYSRGVLFVTYEELDLYKYRKTGKATYNKVSDRYSSDDAKYVLNDIAKMYRKALR